MPKFGGNQHIAPMIETAVQKKVKAKHEKSASLPAPSPVFRFSGHQTFALRIAWIPKAVSRFEKGQDPLTNPDEGITKLGLGKNMVEALRCWIEAFQIAHKPQGEWLLTHIGNVIFNPEDGLDPYLEDVCTSWLLHWLICTNAESPFFAWECVFNRWSSSEFTSSQIIEAFEKETRRTAKPVSAVTLKQHWEVFLHSYRPTREDKGEDHLDSAMSCLRLIREAGERTNANGKSEILYSFDAGRKSAIPEQLFWFFVHCWWSRYAPKEKTIPLRDLVLGDHSPGRLLKMQEAEVVERVTAMAEKQPKVFQIIDSISLRQLHRPVASDGLDDLKVAYLKPSFI